jgi:Fe-S-cluster containining protein
LQQHKFFLHPFEVARILKEPLNLSQPWFEYVGRDRRSPSGYKFTTLVKNRRCIFQGHDWRCLVYSVRPRFCAEFPLENGKKAPYYHELCHHGKKEKRH